MRKATIFIALTLLLTGCARVDILPKADGFEQKLTADEARYLANAGKPLKFNKQEIDHIIGDVVSMMKTEPSTRSSGTRTVASIRSLPVGISNMSTRSDNETDCGSEDSLVYVVNFADDNGYYTCGLFDMNNNPDLPSNTRAWVGEHWNYQYGLRIYPEIHIQ